MPAECMRVIECSGMATMPKGNLSLQDYLEFVIADAAVYFNGWKRGLSYILFSLLGLLLVCTLN